MASSQTCLSLIDSFLLWRHWCVSPPVILSLKKFKRISVEHEGSIRSERFVMYERILFLAGRVDRIRLIHVLIEIRIKNSFAIYAIAIDLILSYVSSSFVEFCPRSPKISLSRLLSSDRSIEKRSNLLFSSFPFENTYFCAFRSTASVRFTVGQTYVLTRVETLFRLLSYHTIGYMTAKTEENRKGEKRTRRTDPIHISLTPPSQRTHIHTRTLFSTTFALCIHADTLTHIRRHTHMDKQTHRLFFSYFFFSPLALCVFAN